MTGLLGYNLLSDANSIDPTLVYADGLIITAITNGIFDHLYITNDVDAVYNTTKPDGWDYDTIINVDFDGNIAGGNAGPISNVTEVKIKRRPVGTFDWTTIKVIPINDPSELTFIFNDNLALNNTNYEYAFVPVTEGVEGAYTVEQVLAQFRGVFICDDQDIYRFYYGTQYGTGTQTQTIGVYNTFNRKYPVVITNAALNYMTGSVSGRVMPVNYAEDIYDQETGEKIDTHKIDPNDVRIRRDQLLQFLTNKKPKIIKDWNNNAWLCFITGNPSVAYENNVGMGMVSVNANWTETGDPESKADLFANGLIPTEE